MWLILDKDSIKSVSHVLLVHRLSHPTSAMYSPYKSNRSQNLEQLQQVSNLLLCRCDTAPQATGSSDK